MNPRRIRIRKITQDHENASSPPVGREGWGDERPKVGRRCSFEILKTKRDDIIDETAEPSASGSQGIQVTIRCVDGSNLKGSLMAMDELNLPDALEKRLGGFLSSGT